MVQKCEILSHEIHVYFNSIGSVKGDISYRLSITVTIVISEYDEHTRLGVVWHISTRIFINCSSANVVSIALILSYQILCPKRFNQRMVLTESVFRFTVRPSWTCFVALFLTNAYIVNKILGKGVNNSEDSVCLFVGVSKYWKWQCLCQKKELLISWSVVLVRLEAKNCKRQEKQEFFFEQSFLPPSIFQQDHEVVLDPFSRCYRFFLAVPQNLKKNWFPKALISLALRCRFWMLLFSIQSFYCISLYFSNNLGISM